MSKDWDFLSDQALSLPIASRFELARRLIDSLDDEKAAELRTRWTQLAAERWSEIESGQVTCPDSADVFRRARENLR
jgi:hypothetical protein